MIALFVQRYELGMMLIGLALIHQQKTERANTSEGNGDTSNQGEDLQTRVARVTKALSPFLLPMIDALGGLEEAEVEAATEAGEAP